MYQIGSALVTAATFPLGLGMAGDVYVVIAKISGSFVIGSVTGGLAFALLTGLWYIYPLLVAHTALASLFANAEDRQQVISNCFRR